MNIKTSIAIGLLILLLCSNCTNDNKTNQPESTAILAERPPMGWNSWICFGTSVTEDEVKANADFMAENLKKYGWEYIVIDAGWYAPGMETLEQYESSTPHQIIDKFGRLIVDTEKFPSAKNNGKTYGKAAIFYRSIFQEQMFDFTGQSNRCVLYSFYEIEQMFLLVFHRLTESGESGC